MVRRRYRKVVFSRERNSKFFQTQRISVEWGDPWKKQREGNWKWVAQGIESVRSGNWECKGPKGWAREPCLDNQASLNFGAWWQPWWCSGHSAGAVGILTDTQITESYVKLFSKWVKPETHDSGCFPTSSSAAWMKPVLLKRKQARQRETRFWG